MVLESLHNEISFRLTVHGPSFTAWANMTCEPLMVDLVGFSFKDADGNTKFLEQALTELCPGRYAEALLTRGVNLHKRGKKITEIVEEMALLAFTLRRI